MTEKKTDKSEKNIDDVSPVSGLIEDRLTEQKEIEMGGNIYVIRPLSETILSLAGDASDENGKYNGTVHLLTTLRYGLIDILPLKGKKLLDRKGKKVKIARDSIRVLGTRMDCIRWEFINKIPMKTATKIFVEIGTLSNLTVAEADSADFISASDPEG